MKVKGPTSAQKGHLGAYTLLPPHENNNQQKKFEARLSRRVELIGLLQWANKL